ncbi:M13 family metallopeptidase [Pontibacter sp. G13]|uniref:M13 family metallopeptidase n=1 Tax=Pontibacter sp. G13 TaxID=3074898 RepID=UPI002889D81E|nr:M13 family metallopeptidase [Pontibacter sp. G13]WNJ18613.1 M13 family metallopeptidase [Pontibacter sp. G13]
MRNSFFIASGVALGLVGGLTSCTTPGGTGEAGHHGHDHVHVPAFEVSSLDTSIAPCHDFFQYTSGGWIENNPIPETEGRWGRFNLLGEENNAKLKAIMEELVASEELAKGSHQQLVGDYFYTAMDSAKIEADGLKYIQPYLDAIVAVASIEEMVELLAKHQTMGFGGPYAMYVSPDQKNSEVHVLGFSQSGLGLPDRDYYLKDDERSTGIQEAYRKHIANMFVLAGGEEAKAQADAQAIYDLETKMAEIQMSRVDRRNPYNTYNNMTVADLQASAPGLLIDRYMATRGYDVDTLIVGMPDYAAGLSKLFQSESLDTWKAYMHFHALSSKASQLPKVFVEENFDFYSRTLRGTQEMKPRWKRALAFVGGGLGEQVGHLFADKHFPESSKQQVVDMVENLREVYKDRVMGLTWMGEETKQKALAKLNAFTYKIGYPDKYKDYSDLDVNRESLLMNGISMSQYLSKRNLDKLNKPVDKGEWFMGAHIVNAYYNPSNNEIVFPAGILQPPFFNPDADDAINYGAIGGVIGHEFTHGFDDQGSKYGPDGNLENWWTEEDRANFDLLAQAMIDQYSAYEPLEGVKVNGALTLGENIADLGGLTLGYHAYLKSREGKSAVPDIDGFTDRQRVFLGWAQVWQLSYKDARLANQVLTDPHAPAMYRVVGPMSNMDEFEEAFGCGGDMMRENEERIQIW